MKKYLLYAAAIGVVLLIIALIMGYTYGNCDSCRQAGILRRFSYRNGEQHYFCGTCYNYAKFYGN